MNISADKKTITAFAIIALLVGVIIGVLFTQSDRDGFLGMNHDSSHNGMMTTSPNPMSPPVVEPDVMFFQMMIPHHQQAIDMSNLALKNSTNPELLALANSIIDAQAKEISTMQQWLTEAGAPADNHAHMGHGMDGMLSDEEYAALENSRGTEFDKLWLQGMIGHHQGALQMVGMITDSAVNETKQFGKGIKSAQSAEIAQMREMLAKLG